MFSGDWFARFAALLAGLALLVGTLSPGRRRRLGRGVGLVAGGAAAVGLAGVALLLVAGPEGLARLHAQLPGLPGLGAAPPLPNVIRPTPRAEAPVPRAEGAKRVSGPVTRVRDGDTIEVAGVPVRFAGVDCAERGTAAGDAATRAMRELADGRQVRCELIGRRSYDREIGTCYLADGRDISGVLVSRGLCAWR